MHHDQIIIKGACEHNLKCIDATSPVISWWSSPACPVRYIKIHSSQVTRP